MRVSLTPALCLLTLAATTALATAGADTVTGSGKLARDVRSVPAFRGIELQASVDLEFRVGSPQRVEIVADDNILPFITTTVSDGSLRIGTGKQSFSTRTPLRAVVVAPDLGALAIRGSGDAVIDGIANRSFAVSIEGSGDVRVTGKSASVAVSIKGSGDVTAKHLIGDSVAVAVSGSGDVCVHATQSVTATVNGSGAITIHGKPKSVHRKVNGSGEIRLE